MWEGRGWEVFAVALNEILFGGGTQLGNIRTRRLCERVHTAVQKQADTGAYTRSYYYYSKGVLVFSLSVSFFTSLSLSCVFFQHTPPFDFSLLPVFALCVSCELKDSGFWGCRLLDSVVWLMSWERATGLYRQPLTGQH